MRNRFFYDTEFLEDGSTIELISIGIVAGDGRSYYAVNSDMPVDRIRRNDWLMENVAPSLPVVRPPRKSAYNDAWNFTLDLNHVDVKPHWVIRNEVRDFILGDPASEELPAVELWADYGAYDHVALSQLFGPMIKLPEGMPMFTREFQQRLSDLGYPEVPKQVSGLHNALDDALHLKIMFDFVSAVAA